MTVSFLPPAMDEPEVVDLRCPVNPSRLFARLRIAGEKPSFIQPDNLIEMSCWDCKTRYRRAGRRVHRVLHRYDMAGTLISTLVEDEADTV